MGSVRILIVDDHQARVRFRNDRPQDPGSRVNASGGSLLWPLLQPRWGWVSAVCVRESSNLMANSNFNRGVVTPR